MTINYAAPPIDTRSPEEIGEEIQKHLPFRDQPAKTTYKVIIEWETDLQGLAVLNHAIVELQEHGKAVVKVETVQR